MGMVLRFSPRSPRIRSAVSTRQAGPAEVLLFTGIRYERGSGQGTDKPVRSIRRRRKG